MAELIVRVPVNPVYPQSPGLMLANAQAAAARRCADAVFVSSMEVTGTASAVRVDVPGVRTYEFRFSGTRPDNAA